MTGLELAQKVRSALTSGEAIKASDIIGLCQAIELANARANGQVAQRREYMRLYMRQYRARRNLTDGSGLA